MESTWGYTADSLIGASLDQFAQSVSLRREVSAQHLPGFLWNAADRIFEESSGRFNRRMNTHALYAELVAGIRRNHGSTLYGMMVADLALRIERATEGYELDAAGVALQVLRNGLSDEMYRTALFARTRALGDE